MLEQSRFYGADFTVKYTSYKESGATLYQAKALWAAPDGDTYERGSVSSTTRKDALYLLYAALVPEYKQFRLRVMRGNKVITSLIKL
jgi:hypothetical protein